MQDLFPIIFCQFRFINLAPVVQRLDCAIQHKSTKVIIHWTSIVYHQNILKCPVDSGLCNGWWYPPFEQRQPGERERTWIEVYRLRKDVMLGV